LAWVAIRLEDLDIAGIPPDRATGSMAMIVAFMLDNFAKRSGLKASDITDISRLKWHEGRRVKDTMARYRRAGKNVTAYFARVLESADRWEKAVRKRKRPPDHRRRSVTSRSQ
jgi:hypothetical protein